MALERHLDLARPGVLVRVADGLGEDGLRERLERLGHGDTFGPAAEREVKIRVLAAQALDLLEQGRLRLGRRAAERALQRPPQVHERRLELGGDPLRAPPA